MPQSRMVSATRATSWRTPVSRSGVPILPCRYFDGHDVGGGHGPVFGDFDVFLLEDDVALGVGDLSEAEFPFDFVVGRDAGLGEEAAEGEAGGLLLCGGGEGSRGGGGGGGGGFG